MYQYALTPKAAEQMRRLTKRNPQLSSAILRKIKWLVEHAEEIEHQPIKGTPYFSLHSASFRIPYLLDKTQERIIIAGIGQHDLAYDRVNREK